MPSSIERGKVFAGRLTSSAMFTESSKPTIAKNASAVAEVIASSTPDSEVSISVSRLGSPAPVATAYTPITMMMSSPESSMSVSTRFA